MKKTTESISVSLPSNLIQIMDHAAGRLDISRSDFIRKAIKKFILYNSPYLSGLGADGFWDRIYQEVFDKS